MSVQRPPEPQAPSGAKPARISVPDLVARKGKEPIVCLTAYTTPMARRLDPHVDLLLVGDSLGMVLYGLESTIPVTLDMMCLHGAAVSWRRQKPEGPGFRPGPPVSGSEFGLEREERERRAAVGAGDLPGHRTTTTTHQPLRHYSAEDRFKRGPSQGTCLT